MKKNKSTIILILVFFVGLSVMLYPTLSDYVNQLHQSRAVATYAEDVDNLTDADYSAYFEAADAFNAQIAADPDALYFPQRFPTYESTLDVTGTGIMGYITIEKIGVELPIYHGTSDSVLQIAAGHLEGTSLPVGGASTHAVISAHRGLPSAKLFTNLDQLEVGDTFTITVLDRVLTYEVDNISIVLPTETDSLKVSEGKDYITLMTCTPYGINTHRLLVRGRRITTPDKLKHIRVTSDAIKIEPILTAPIMALALLLVLLFPLCDFVFYFLSDALGEEPATWLSAAENLPKLALAYAILPAKRVRAGKNSRPAGENSLSEEEQLQRLSKVCGLSERESEIAKLIFEGKNNKEMAELLYLSPNTVKVHASNLYRKLGASNRVQAVQILGGKRPPAEGVRRGA